MWETVSLWNDNLLMYAVTKRTDHNVVQFMLKSSAHDLITFGPTSNDRVVQVVFPPEFDIDTALKQTFGIEKLKVTGVSQLFYNSYLS